MRWKHKSSYSTLKAKLIFICSSILGTAEGSGKRKQLQAGLKKLIITRIFWSIVIIIVIINLNFFLFRMMGGEAAVLIGAQHHLSEKDIIALRKEMGLDKPIWTQFYLYLSNVFQGKWGRSFVTRRPVWEEIQPRLMNTLLLVGSAVAIAALFGIIVGIHTASGRSKMSKVIVTGSLFLCGIPVFWLGMILVSILGVQLGWFPIYGVTTRPPPEDAILFIVDLIRHLVLPAGTLALNIFASFLLLTRSSMLDEITEAYVLTAKAKGLSKHKILYDQVFRNARLPVVSWAAITFTTFITGAIQVEIVFSWNGLGMYVFRAVQNRDYPCLEATFLIVSILIVAANFIADLLHGILDPRIREV